MQDQFSEAARLLREVLSNRITVEDALEKWPSVNRDSNRWLKAAYEQLHHYASDDDIRRKDLRYAERQRLGLQRCLEMIEAPAKAAADGTESA